MEKEIYWHLPGMTVYFYLNQVVINMLKEFPDKFRDGYKVGAVYGTFPGAIWNGGRATFGLTLKSDMKKIIDTYNKFGVPVKFTWTNSLIEEEHVHDTYCNLIMDIANNGMNHVLCNSPILEVYLRNKYPDFKYISSTTKRIKDLDELKKEFEKDYELVVLDYDLNHDENALKELEPYADRIEILVDEICFPNCKKRIDHYKEESRCQLTFDKGDCFDCLNTKQKPSFEIAKTRPHFISADQVSEYVDRGFCNFKLIGRGLPMDMVIESYVYYLAKEEEREWVTKRIRTTLQKIVGR